MTTADVVDYPPEVVQFIVDTYATHLGQEMVRMHGLLIHEKLRVRQIESSRDLLVRRCADMQARLNKYEGSDGAPENGTSLVPGSA